MFTTDENAELTVEQALKELRETCPGHKVFLERRDHGTINTNGEMWWDASSVELRVQAIPKRKRQAAPLVIRTATLREALDKVAAQVRAWKESQ